MPDILIAAATRWEIEPLRAAGVAGHRRVRLLATGIGPERAASALSGIAGMPPGGLVVSAGFAGGLNPRLRAGDLVAAQLTPCPDAEQALRRAATRLGIIPRFGEIAHSPRVLREATEKRALGERTGALAVDMESAAIASWARERALPALALRVVLDDADFSMPPDLPGQDSLGAAALYAATHPAQWPRLWRLWLRQRRAARILASCASAFLEEI